MDAKSFDQKQNENLRKLLLEDEPLTDTEKKRDIYNLKIMRYSIRFGSKSFRMGFIKTLDRAIEMMEKGESR